MEGPADDRARFAARMYAESGPRLYRYALMIPANAYDAADVVQQVFAAVFYGVGENRKDDGGLLSGFASGNPQRTGAGSNVAGDIGIRVPLKPRT